MSTRKRQKKSRLFSDLKLTRDANGRLRIGGRFASAKQVGRLQGARKRRGVKPAPVQRSIPKVRRPVGKTKASRASQKAAISRKFNQSGVLRREYITPRARYENVEYTLPEIDAELILLCIQREQIGNDRLIAYSKLVGEDEDGNEVAVGTPMTIIETGQEKREAGQIALDMEELAAAYLIATLLDIYLVISKPRSQGNPPANVITT